MGPLIQLHWQKKDNHDQTEFVAQCNLEGWAEYHSIPLRDAFDHWTDHLKAAGTKGPPEGWQQLVIDSTHPYFVWAKQPTK